MKLYDNDEYRDEFMAIVYALLHSDGTNDRALSLEELREMDGEPYWHVGLRDDSPTPHWAILPSNVAQRPQDYFYGKYWLAYRRKPEETLCT